MGQRSYTLPQPWEDAVNGWLSWLRLQGATETTLKTRRGQIRALARRSNTRRPCDITLSCLVELCGRPGVSADHRHGQRAALISFFTWCLNNDVTHVNPAEQLPRIKASKPRPRPTPDEVWFGLLRSADPRDALMALLACEAGLRRAEVAGLHYDDLARDHDGWLLIVRGKGGKQRVVPITNYLATRLRHHCRGGFIFPGQIDGHMSPDAVGRIVSRLMPKGWTMHKLRHRFASNGFMATKDLLAVRDVLGHSSVATTQIYTASPPNGARAISEAVALRNRISRGGIVNDETLDTMDCNGIGD